MNRLLVALLAAIDALIAATVGVVAALAPLTLFWVLGFGGTADWGALWPTAVRVWHLGQLVPLEITLSPEYLAAAGVSTDAATFWISLAPLAFAGFTAVFAARSGTRAARSGAWAIGVAAGTVVTLVAAVLLWRTSSNPVAAVYGWQAIVMPTLVYAVPAFLGAIVGAWRNGDDGIVDDIQARFGRGDRWDSVPDAAASGLGVALAGFIGIGALIVGIATIARGGEVVALFESAHVDALGAVSLAIGQLAYLPTLVVWGGAFAAGPGFALGTGTAVSPVGTDLGVLPGIPALGIIPEDVSSWMLLCVLLIIAVGFGAGLAARMRLPGARTHEQASTPRLVALGVIVVGGALGVAVLAFAASGAVGPDRLATVGPSAGPLAFAVGVELAIGAAIALFSPLSREQPDAAASALVTATVATTAAPDASRRTVSASPVVFAEADTQPFEQNDLDPLAGLAAPDESGSAPDADPRPEGAA